MLALINQVLEFLNSLSGPVLAGAAVALEFILRFIPSAKPLGIAQAIGGALKGLGVLFSKAGEILDKVLPQKIKELQ